MQKRVAGIHRPPVFVSTIEYALDLLGHGASCLRAIRMKGHLGFIGPIQGGAGGVTNPLARRLRCPNIGIVLTRIAPSKKETFEMAATVPDFENGLAEEARNDIVRHLADVLDAVYSLMIRTHVYHWNVEGPLFEPVHKLAEVQYTSLFAAVDEIAERMRALDGKPAVNVNGFPTGVANLPESQPAESMIGDLVRQHETVVRRMREVIAAAERAKDVVTADLLTGLIAQHEKNAWMLRATLRS